MIQTNHLYAVLESDDKMRGETLTVVKKIIASS